MNTIANIIGWTVIYLVCGVAVMAVVSRLLDYWWKRRLRAIRGRRS